jgi:hypothetical protein
VSEDPVKDPKESFSQFLARVFDQLSITAWLPAMMVVAVALLLSQLARADGSLTEAFDSIGKIGIAGLVFLVAAVVLTTMFTQAFEFGAIRTLEGYWLPTGVVGWLARRRCHSHAVAKEQLQERRGKAVTVAVQSAKDGLRAKHGVGSARFDALESIVANLRTPDTTSDEDLDFAETELVPIWKAYADPPLIAWVDGLDRLLEDFPKHPHRILPTRLGNVMRAAEDRLRVPPTERLENFVLHRLDNAPFTIARNYREQRRRLDLYCGLVFVFIAAVAGAVGVALTFPPEPEPVMVAIAITGLFALLAMVSYRAATATARKLGYALVAIKADQDERIPAAGAAPP